MHDLPLTRLTADGKLEVICSNIEDSDRIKHVPGRIWSRFKGGKYYWLIPVTADAITRLRQLLPSAPIPPEVDRILSDRRMWEGMVSRAKAGKHKMWPGGFVSHITPYDHQRVGFSSVLAILDGSPGAGLWHDMGLGKTLTCLAVLAADYQTGGVPINALVTCPSSVIGVWVKAAELCTFPLRVIPLTGPVPRRALTVQQSRLDPFDGVTLFVTNYEVLWKETLMNAFFAVDLEYVIADEAQALKTHSSKQSIAARKIASKSKKIASTGTPVDKVENFFGIMRWLNPDIFGTSYTAFLGHYFEQVILPGVPHPKIVGPKPEMYEELMTKIHSISHSAKKEECLDLPEKVDIDIEVELEPKVMKMYRQMRDEAIAWLDDGQVVLGENVLTRMMRLVQITGGFVTNQYGHPERVSEAKLKAATEQAGLVIEQQGKLVVFCRFTAEIDALQGAIQRQGAYVKILDGRTPPGATRDKLVEEFQEGELECLIVQEKAGGAGITLHAASTAIDYSRSPDLIPWLQKRDRIHRIGMGDKPATYLNMIVPNTLDEKLLKNVLREKRNVHELSVHGWKGML